MINFFDFSDPPPPEQRLQALRDEGLTVEIESLRIDAGTTCVPAFGDEFWIVGEQYEIDPVAWRVHGGRLVLKDGEPLADRGELLARGIRVETVHIST